MRRLPVLLVALLVASGCNNKKLFDNGTLLDLDSGSHATKSSAFNPQKAWTLTYSYDCAKQHVEGEKDLDRFDLIVYNSDDDSYASEDPHLHLVGKKGTATLHRKVPGWYYLTIDTPCDWKLNASTTPQ